MWTASCSYVRKLYEPRHFAAAMERLHEELLSMNNNNTDTDNDNEQDQACFHQPKQWSLNHLGTGRFAAERWAFSHPHVQPCSSLPRNVKIARVPSKRLLQPPTDQSSKAMDPLWNPTLTTEPRKPPAASGLTLRKFQTSFARLPGRLREWQALYPDNARPPPNSWIWSYYQNFVNGTQKHFDYCLEQQQQKQNFEAKNDANMETSNDDD